ncbi:uncharacterized protein PGTG_05337 [Puccinia graminis f. sp. tritici CRL 75-36-700-3]|uniref:Uncharacterized protein n=1 Tax=Puccinia graminis f. sp. tritici (strain CRL 75-36-700-3 / race SCCL) TaxID=418459 RepID=E3K746_PUCGT|nr:uncharacterized protein PGTG_05337 [Puccinia graminis f. sp. tritici CRL 75-36-700-3]EFP80112.1 hypothetical protein PGTG_05337 [Puccinia graminis f. sp. tritici CRL 75-36-700-3]
MDGPEVFSVAGLKRGSDYDGDRSLNSQAINFLNSQHQQSYQRVVDFDLHAVFLMQEFRAEDTIQQIITMISTTFTEEYPPKNTLQQQLVNAAKLVNQRIQNYEQQPHMLKPFCLRFPTYSDVLKHCMELQDKCEVLPNDKMVILIDEGGVCVGVGLPPKPQSTQSIHTPRDPLSAGAADKTIKFATYSIKKIDLQGHGDHWKSDPKPNLPEPLRSDPGSYNARPGSAVKYLEKKASTTVKESIQVEKNIIIAGLHGYSFHGPFRILFQGVSQFHFTEDITDPRRYSVAMWSRASSFSAIARFSAHDNGNEKFSDDKYWLPLYPEYNPKITSDLLKAEVKIAKKEAKKESKKRQKTEN